MAPHTHIALLFTVILVGVAFAVSPVSGQAPQNDREQNLKTGEVTILPALKPPAPKDSAAARPETSFFKIAAGSTAGSYFATSEDLAAIISHPPGADRCDDTARCGPVGMFAVAQNSDGAIVNIRAVATTEIESGLAPADLLFEAYQGTGAFANDGPMTNLRLIARLYSESLHLVVPKTTNITQVGDLNGLRVSLGRVGSGSHTYAQQLLEANGIAIGNDVVTLDLYDAAEQLLSGELDAFFYLGGAPVPIIQDILMTDQVKLIPITGAPVATFYGERPYMEPILLGSEVYPNTTQLETIASGTYWFTHDSISEERIARITSALWHEANQAEYATTESLLYDITRESALKDLPLPLHPGAESYYQEAGFFQKAAPDAITGGIFESDDTIQD